VTDPVPLSHLDPDEKAVRAASFGDVADDYHRYRPGPSAEAIEWVLPQRVATVVDLGAGTGVLTRLLVDRAEVVVAVEPDDRMRGVLAEQVPQARALDGRGEAMPLPDASADAVCAHAAWHWMDPVRALAEVGRVLVPGGTLGVLWSGPDRDSQFIAGAQALLAQGGGEDGETGDRFADFMRSDVVRPTPTLEIPDGLPFGQPEFSVFTWEMPLTADDLIGLLGTLSWFITMEEDRRARVLDEARRLLDRELGVKGDVTIDVPFRADVWKARRNG
jgi:SAM-dependent methyltransferase